jgi:hypothetical protein
MAYRVHQLKPAIDDLAALITKSPINAGAYQTAYSSVIKQLEQDPKARSAFHRPIVRDLLIGLHYIQFTESWSCDCHPIRVWFYISNPNGNASAVEIAIYGVQEIPPLVSRRLNPGFVP